MDEGGYVRVYRRVLEHPEFQDQGEALCFVWLIMKAAWRPTKVRYKERLIELQRGQLALSVRDFARAMGRSKDWAARFLNRTTNRDMTATATATGVNVITICNYDLYQLPCEDGATANGQQPRHARDRAATQNKEEKERKEGIGSVAKATSPRACRIPLDWQPGPLPANVAELVMQWPQGREKREIDGFRDYWISRSRDAARTNWDLTWHNRIRDQHDRIMKENRNGPLGGNQSGNGRSTTQSAADRVFGPGCARNFQSRAERVPSLGLPNGNDGRREG